MATAYSSFHQQKPPRLPTPKKPSKLKSKVPISIPSPLPSLSSINTSVKMEDPSEIIITSRSSSLAGKKRPRESDGEVKIKPRRTQSVGGGDSFRMPKENEAFQKGLLAVFVPRALEEATRGKMEKHNDLLGYFLPTPLGPSINLSNILQLVRFISANANLLKPGIHGSLVTAMANLNWATGDDRFVKAYIGWAGVIISAHPEWLTEIVGMAIKGLSWQPSISSSSLSSFTRRQYHARYHLLLTHLLSLIPTLPNIMLPILIKRIPHKREREVSQITFLRNILELSEYCSELQSRVWSEIIDRLLRIDAEITKASDLEDDDEEEDDEEEEERLMELCKASVLERDPWEMLINEDIPQDPVILSPEEEDENEDELEIDDLSSDGGEAEDDEEEQMNDNKLVIIRMKKKLHLILMRRKLDGMLWYFMKHLEEALGYRSHSPPINLLAASTLKSPSGQSTPTAETPIPTPISLLPSKQLPSPAASLAMFQTLLNIFSRQILSTSSTQHIPFLLFLTSSFSPSHTDLLLGLLVSQSLYGSSSTTTSSPMVTQPVPLRTRIAATVYIGSIVCRARFVTDLQTRQVMAYLLAFIEGKIQQSRMMGKIEDPPLFYAVCQAVMLIFCFRWRALQSGSNNNEEEMLGEMELEGDIEDSGEEGKWMKELDVLEKALTCELNPLLGCNPDIVQTFAKVAHQTNFAYCYSIIESNALSTRSASSHSLSNNSNLNKSKPIPSRNPSSASASSLSNPFTSFTSSGIMFNLGVPKSARQYNLDAGLDSYFPFDPLDLPRTGGRIEDLYRTWNEVAIHNDDSDEESIDDSDEEEENDDDVDEEEDEVEETLGESPLSDHLSPKVFPKGTKIKLGSSSDRKTILKENGVVLSSSFEGMSISPRDFKL